MFSGPDRRPDLQVCRIRQFTNQSLMPNAASLLAGMVGSLRHKYVAATLDKDLKFDGKILGLGTAILNQLTRVKWCVNLATPALTMVGVALFLSAPPPPPPVFAPSGPSGLAASTCLTSTTPSGEPYVSASTSPSPLFSSRPLSQPPLPTSLLPLHPCTLRHLSALLASLHPLFLPLLASTSNISASFSLLQPAPHTQLS